MRKSKKRYKLSMTNDEALKILGRHNSCGIYRFDHLQKREDAKKKLEEIRSLYAFNKHCNERGIDPNEVPYYWDKTKEFSVLIRKADSDKTDKISIDQIIDKLQRKLSKHSPNYAPLQKQQTPSNNLLVIDPADIHFGKLARAYETGENYNIDIAKQRCVDGVAGIVSKARGFGIDRILLIIGNDVLHYDNPKRTTTSGTPQDTDVMFYDMFNAALETHVQIIESLMSEFEVDVIFCPSNHDYQSGWMFARTLSAWFRNAEQVNIDDSIAHRKYYQYGLNLIGASHGDGAKMTDMPLLMANEVPKMWAETKFRHVYLHHIHHKQRNMFQSGKDYIGVTVEYLRSPSESDSWHYRNGYVGAKKAVEGFIHNFNDGQIARLTHYFK